MNLSCGGFMEFCDKMTTAKEEKYQKEVLELKNNWNVMGRKYKAYVEKCYKEASTMLSKLNSKVSKYNVKFEVDFKSPNYAFTDKPPINCIYVNPITDMSKINNEYWDDISDAMDDTFGEIDFDWNSHSELIMHKVIDSFDIYEYK